MSKVLKFLFRSFLVLLGLIVVYVLFAFIVSSISVSEEPAASDDIDIYILTNGVHTDIVVPTITEHVNWFSKISHLQNSRDNSFYTYLAIGWGDRGFYLNTPTWAELKLSTALSAIVGLSGSVMHATFYRQMKEDENCIKISISHEQYERLVAYIVSSFQMGEDGHFIKIDTDANYGNTDAFYEAHGRYHLFNSCNNWSNEALKHSGQKACLWTIFQGPIFRKYR